MLTEFMAQIAKDMETDPFNQEPPGTYNLPFGEDFIITATQPLGSGIHLTAVVAACPKDQQDMFFTQALLANLFGQGTKGAILGLNSQGTQLTLSKVLDYNIDYKEFKNEFEDFINACDFWHDEAVGR